RVDSEITEQLECWQRRGPGLALVLGSPVEATRREARASRPLTVCALQREQSGTPALGCHSRALRRDDVYRCVDKIAQYLPPDGRVRIEQPIQYGHAAESNTYTMLVCRPHRSEGPAQRSTLARFS